LRTPHLAYGDAPVAIRGMDGRIWIPMATELAIIDPRVSRRGSRETGSDGRVDAVLITALSADGKAIYRYGGVLPRGTPVPPEAPAPRLPPGTRDLSIDYTCLSLYSPENVHFQYRLTPFDDAWVQAGARRQAAYTRLAPGAYRFEIKACDSDGLWNPAAASLAFSIRPFFWETTWFRTAVFAAVLGVTILLVRYVSHRRLRARLRALEREATLDRERARIARDIHDDLGSRLTNIVMLSGLGGQNGESPEAMAERMAKISEAAQQMFDCLDETVWAVNPRNDTVANLIGHLGEYAANALRGAAIRCHLDLPADPPARAVSSEFRHHLSLVVKEAITNVVRHARAAAAWLTIAVTDSGLSVTLADDGCGFAEAPSAPEADGLRNMRQRVTQLGGRLEIESRESQGTRIFLVVPWIDPN
jgi:signal transduction histidine kinase